MISSFATIISCEEDTTTIGSGIASGEVEINIDTFYFDLHADPIRIESFNSKTGNLMLGNINVPQYGYLNCSFVTRLMCAVDLQIPDSLLLPERVDSCKIIMAAERSGIVGDSLSPQKLTVYMLNRQLPKDIDNNFNPEGYYDPSEPLGELSYTVSNIASSDSMFYKSDYIELRVDLPTSFGKEIFEKYRNNPSIFQWPQTFANEFIPGLYLKPSFGKGCVANINELLVGVFYHTLIEKTTITDNDTVKEQVHSTRTAVPFSISPEVLSSNNITYIPSDRIDQLNSLDNGECVVTTPGGYLATFKFPVQPIIDRYNQGNIHLSTVNDMVLYIPAESLDDNSGITLVENLLLIKSSEYESFFKENKIPDNLTSFTGIYDSKNERYVFNSLRDYFLNLVNKDNITEEDVTFTLVPVQISTETVSGYYGNSSTYVTKCVPYTAKPTLTKLKTGDSMVTFSFTTQIID